MQRWLLKGLVGAGLLLSGSTAQAVPNYRFWTECTALVTPERAAELGIAADFCERHQGVIKTDTERSMSVLFLVSKINTVRTFNDGRVSVALNLNAAYPSLHIYGSFGLGDPEQVETVRKLRARHPEIPPLETWHIDHQMQVQALLDSRVYETASRIGVFPVPGEEAIFFKTVGLSLNQLPVYGGPILVAGSLTDYGRRFFKHSLGQEIDSFDAIVSWRVVHVFSPDVIVASSGSLPCLKIGPKVRPFSSWGLPHINDERWLTRCEGE